MSEIVRLTQIDGKLPNLALMKLARYHRERGDEIHFTKHVERGLFEPRYDRWAIRKAYTFIPFEHYHVNAKGRGEARQLAISLEA